MEEDLCPVTPVPCVGDGEAADEEWVTFFNPSIGKTLRLPRHTEEEAAERWRFRGAWTSWDDRLSPRALRIVEDIQPVVKRMRLPEGPHWWEQCSAERAEQQQDTSLPLPPPDWNLPAFPACAAAPCHRGMSEAGASKVPLPTHGRRGSGGAARGGRRRRPHPFLTVVAAVVFMILAPWLAFHGDRFLDTWSGRVDG